jgi:hypothetical protein
MRLTENAGWRYFPKRDEDGYMHNSMEIVSKLGRLEDIEDKLGVRLETLFLALDGGIILKGEKGLKTCQLRMFHEEPMLVTDDMDGTSTEVYVEGHGESWKLPGEAWRKSK